MSLTVSGCGLAVYPPGATFGPRRLQDFEFVWLLQGTAEQWPLRTRCAGVGPSVTLVASPSSTRSIPSSLTEIVQGGSRPGSAASGSLPTGEVQAPVLPERPDPGGMWPPIGSNRP
jgi:hypothetical protein